jgi:FkbM family methyltransferase
MARAVGPKGRVVAFEPMPESARQLRRNLYLNDIQNVTVIEKALGEKATAGVMRVTDPTNMGGTQTCTQAEIAAGTLDCGHAASDAPHFAMVRMDDLDLHNLSLVKIDVEGHELGVLRGARATLLRDHPVILIEIWDSKSGDATPSTRQQTIDYLQELGYRVENIETHNFIAFPKG